MPHYRFAVKDAARYDDPDGTDRARRRCRLGLRHPSYSGGTARARNTTGRDGRWRSGRASALCGKSPLKGRAK